jgi:hypothetical protein
MQCACKYQAVCKKQSSFCCLFFETLNCLMPTTNVFTCYYLCRKATVQQHFLCVITTTISVLMFTLLDGDLIASRYYSAEAMAGWMRRHLMVRTPKAAYGIDVRILAHLSNLLWSQSPWPWREKSTSPLSTVNCIFWEFGAALKTMRSRFNPYHSTVQQADGSTGQQFIPWRPLQSAHQMSQTVPIASYRACSTSHQIRSYAPLVVRGWSSAKPNACPALTILCQ